jgi:hypothetical protein
MPAKRTSCPLPPCENNDSVDIHIGKSKQIQNMSVCLQLAFIEKSGLKIGF